MRPSAVPAGRRPSPAPPGNAAPASPLLTGSLWVGAGYALRLVATAGSYVWVARILGPAAFGRYALVVSSLTVMAVAADLGMATTVTRFLSRGKALEANRVVALALVAVACASVIGAGTVWALAAPIARHALTDAGLAAPLRAGAAAVGAIALGNVLAAMLQGLLAFRRLAITEAAAALASCALIVGGALGRGMPGAVGGFAAGAALRAALFAWRAAAELRSRGVRVAVRGAWRAREVALTFSIPALASALLVEPTMWAVRALLAARPDGFAQLGLFAAAMQWQTPLVFAGGVVGTVVLPHLSRLHRDDSPAELRGLALRSFFAFGVVQLALAWVLVVLSRPLVALFGTGYAGAIRAVPAVVAGALLSSLLATLASLIAAMGHMWTGFMLNLFWACTLVGSAAVLVPRLGARGAALAFALAYLLHTATTTWTLSIRIGVRLRGEAVRVLALCAIVLGPAVAWSAYGASVLLVPLSAVPLAASLGVVARARGRR